MRPLSPTVERPAAAGPAGDAQALIGQALIGQALIGQALIAEARAHARRRRRRPVMMLAAAAIVAAAGALLAGLAGGPGHAPAQRPRASLPAARTGIVTGHLAACYGVAFPNRPLPVTPGTVVALRGMISWAPDGPGAWRIVWPKGPGLARAYIGDNYDQAFRFALPPGQYVLVGSYEQGNASTYAEVTVTAGRTVRAGLPDRCL